MSSPVIPRMSSRSSLVGNPKHEEELINAYEAEEERIINVLSRKLEQLKEEKIQLENALEAESESHVNRLTRELAALRAQQLQQQQQQHPRQGTSATSTPGSDDGRDLGMNAMLSGADPRYPSQETLLEALRRENESLRNRLVDMEREFIKVVRQNDMYREELIDHRRRLGLSVDNLIGLGGDQPLHRRNSSTASSSPTASMVPLPVRPGLPIPRPPSQIHRPSASAHAAHSPRTPSATTTPLTNSPSSSIPTSPNPYPFSPSTSHGVPASSSYATQLTTPPSSTSANGGGLAAQVFAATPLATPLTYPSVPPPSLSSSLGSPTLPYPPRLGAPRTHSRHSSVERGGRIAETGTLSRRASIVSAAAARPLPATVVESSSESPPAAVLLSP